jgi:cation:H+ antiporter
MDAQFLVALVAGLGALSIGAEMLVRGAAQLAARLGLSPLIIGLTVVAFGTSAPELAVGVQSSWSGQTDIAIGNVVGSNIFNVLFVLGVSALVAPLVVAQQLVWLDVPLMIGVSLLVLAMGADGTLSRLEGLLLCAGMVVYIVVSLRVSRRESETVKEEYGAVFGTQSARAKQVLFDLVLVGAGLAALIVGSHWLVTGAVGLARWLGISELVIGLTIVAGGTSLPEVATSVVASFRGQRDIAVGNVVGSNIFNLLAVLGVSAVVAPAGLPVSAAVLGFDLPVMLAAAVACLPIFFTGHEISRWEGGLFFAYYLAYIAYLLLATAQHDALPVLSQVMLLFVIPLTALTLAVLAMRAWRQQGGWQSG